MHADAGLVRRFHRASRLIPALVQKNVVAHRFDPGSAPPTSARRAPRSPAQFPGRRLHRCTMNRIEAVGSSGCTSPSGMAPQALSAAHAVPDQKPRRSQRATGIAAPAGPLLQHLVPRRLVPRARAFTPIRTRCDRTCDSAQYPDEGRFSKHVKAEIDGGYGICADGKP